MRRPPPVLAALTLTAAPIGQGPGHEFWPDDPCLRDALRFDPGRLLDAVHGGQPGPVRWPSDDHCRPARLEHQGHKTTPVLASQHVRWVFMHRCCGRDPERVSGTWVFRGTRVPVAALFENLEDDASLHEFLEWFPGVTAGQARAALDHAARSAFATA